MEVRARACEWQRGVHAGNPTAPCGAWKCRLPIPRVSCPHLCAWGWAVIDGAKDVIRHEPIKGKRLLPRHELPGLRLQQLYALRAAAAAQRRQSVRKSLQQVPAAGGCFKTLRRTRPHPLRL